MTERREFLNLNEARRIPGRQPRREAEVRVEFNLEENKETEVVRVALTWDISVVRLEPE